LKKSILGTKIQQLIPFDITLSLEPYIMQGYPPIQDMELIGIISHQGTKDNGHYIAMTKKEEEWTLYNDAITTQTTIQHIHQTQAYILMYRETPEATRRTPPGQNLPCSEKKDEGANSAQEVRSPTAQQRGTKYHLIHTTISH